MFHRRRSPRALLPSATPGGPVRSAIQSGLEAAAPRTRGRSKLGRALAPGTTFLVSLAGWLAWLAALYRGRVVAQASRETTAPAPRVWEIFEDLDRWRAWQPAVVEAGWLGRARWEPGARFRWTIHRLRVVSRVTAARPGAEAVWEHLIWGHYDRFTWRFLPRGSGSRIEAQVELAGWSVWLLAPWLQMSLNQTLREWVDALAARAEMVDGGP